MGACTCGGCRRCLRRATKAASEARRRQRMKIEARVQDPLGRLEACHRAGCLRQRRGPRVTDGSEAATAKRERQQKEREVAKHRPRPRVAPRRLLDGLLEEALRCRGAAREVREKAPTATEWEAAAAALPLLRLLSPAAVAEEAQRAGVPYARQRAAKQRSGLRRTTEALWSVSEAYGVRRAQE
eukprot:COSAG01_NODE_1095_length_11714_cov_9.062930_6_plen_184_part_00